MNHKKAFFIKKYVIIIRVLFSYLIIISVGCKHEPVENKLVFNLSKDPKNQINFTIKMDSSYKIWKHFENINLEGNKLLLFRKECDTIVIELYSQLRNQLSNNFKVSLTNRTIEDFKLFYPEKSASIYVIDSTSFVNGVSLSQKDDKSKILLYYGILKNKQNIIRASIGIRLNIKKTCNSKYENIQNILDKISIEE